ncbi:MAG: hypothetical protein QOI02_1825 [Actinomycetota bacterium]|nr:hypothetical protein [Actinomycetota bacterium]
MFRRILQVVLRPFVRVSLATTAAARAAVPRPSGNPHVHTTGTNPDRILLVGSGAAVGYGVLSHDLSFAGHLARQLTTLTGRAADIDIFATPDMTATSARTAISAVNLARFDLAVMTLGLNEAGTLHSVSLWRREIAALLDHLRAAGPSSLRVLFVAVPSLTSLGMIPRGVSRVGDRHGRLLNLELESLARGREGVAFVPFEPRAIADTILYRSSETYRAWASQLVSSIVAHLEPSGSSPRPLAVQDEQARQAALERLGILDTPAEERFDRITAKAQSSFGAEAAGISFIDNDRQWFKSRVNLGETEVPRAGTFGEFAMRGQGHFTVEDALKDPRFRNSPLVAGAPFIRFYAGYPIEAPGGECVGTLFVVDRLPRVFTAADAGLLRELALRAQEELWASARNTQA